MAGPTPHRTRRRPHDPLAGIERAAVAIGARAGAASLIALLLTSAGPGLEYVAEHHRCAVATAEG